MTAPSPIVTGLIVCAVVVVLLGAATYHAAVAWRRHREQGAPPATPDPVAINRAIEAMKRLGLAFKTDWLGAERVEWWREGVPLVDGQRCADRILGPAQPTIETRPYDREEGER